MELLFGLILFVVGYVSIVQSVLRYADEPQRRMLVGVVVFLMYGCAFGGLTAVAVAFGDFGLAMMTMLLVITVTEVVLVVYNLKTCIHQIRGRDAVLFALYLLLVLTVTLFSREQRAEYVLMTDLTAPFVSMIRDHSMAAMYHLILNMVMFVPLGFLFARIHPVRFGTPMKVFGMGAAVSTLIEMSQLLFRLGDCDVADILGNAFGALLGLALLSLLHVEQRYFIEDFE